jgi:hypothetical protein
MQDFHTPWNHKVWSDQHSAHAGIEVPLEVMYMNNWRRMMIDQAVQFSSSYSSFFFFLSHLPGLSFRTAKYAQLVPISVVAPKSHFVFE